MSGSSQIELNARLGNMVNELYQLLELYAPAWYTEDLHEKAEAALLAMGKMNTPISRSPSKARACRNLGERPGQVPPRTPPS
jgi:hypothetical protein